MLAQISLYLFARKTRSRKRTQLIGLFDLTDSLADSPDLKLKANMVWGIFELEIAGY
jgi:hypothetical protein